jgi:hypothetical protein
MDLFGIFWCGGYVMIHKTNCHSYRQIKIEKAGRGSKSFGSIADAERGAKGKADEIGKKSKKAIPINRCQHCDPK